MQIKKASEIFLDYKKNYIKLRTYDKYINLMNEILNFFNDIDIKDINTQKIQDFINYLEQKGRSTSTIRSHVMLLKSIIYYFDENKNFNQLRFPKTYKKSIKVYTDEEINKILDYIYEKKINKDGFSYYPNLNKYLGELIAIYTGMRLGEIVALQWKDVNFEQEYIDVNKSVYERPNYESLITSPKSSTSYRQIPLHPKLKKVLRFFKNSCEDNYILGTNKKTPMSVRLFQRQNEKLCKNAGVEHKGMHAYRHYFATHLIKKSNQVKLVSECLGHSNILITQNVYNNPSLEDKKKLLKFMD